MMSTYEEHLEELRAEVSKAVQAFCEFQQTNYDRPGAYVMAWVVSGEYTSPELERNEQSGPFVIVPDGQMVSTSVGLQYNALRHWDR